MKEKKNLEKEGKKTLKVGFWILGIFIFLWIIYYIIMLTSCNDESCGMGFIVAIYSSIIPLAIILIIIFIGIILLIIGKQRNKK
ncbi:MAG: hypothetical protein KKF48_00560 [Nanoarchaeota archaeon]|nr:hypothetical protein [Nanoarchaeota archaeon]MBU1027514.1 hypothetical protein [Nanoarchaeota archaeon]